MVEKQAAISGRVFIGRYEAVLDGKAVAYTLKRGPRCQHARLEVTRETGLTAIIPRRYDIKRVPAFLEANRRWILHALKKYCLRPATTSIRPVQNNTVPYLGEDLEVIREDDGGGSSPVRIEGNKLVVSTGLSGDGALAAALENWYREEAGSLIRGKLDRAVSRLGLSYNRVVIKGMRSRWGSCSVKGNLNFNWKLVLLPEPVIDYVIIHELTHLKEMNHSRKFWELVARECPDWRGRRKWLTKNGLEVVVALYDGQAQ